MSTTVVESPLPTGERPQTRTTSDAAALAFRRRVQVIDRIARFLISASGLTIICAVLGIGLFLVSELLPLFQGAAVRPAPAQPAPAAAQPPLWLTVDEHQVQAGLLGPDPALHVVPLDASAVPGRVPLPGLEGRRLSAVSQMLRDPVVAVGTDTGEVWIGVIELQTVFEGSRRVVRQVVEPDVMLDAVPGHAIRRLAYRGGANGGVIASLIPGPHLILTRLTMQRPLVGPIRRAQESVAVPLPGLGEPTQVLLNEPGTQVLVGTSQGWLIRWRLEEAGAPELVETVEAVPGGSVTALAYLLGDRSIAVGGSDGSVATWSPIRQEERGDGWRLARIHPFPSHPAAVTVIAPSPRDKGFITASADGAMRLHYMTSERTLGRWMAGPDPRTALFSPKADGALAVEGAGRLGHWRIRNPHPEVSWQALFGPMWYEGYDEPGYVWQSTGGTDDFESKFSLVPLVFGTLKGTLYALLFAVPLALLGALYCSQFLDKRWRNPVKSTIELMATLPSVVLGFVAGVVLAPLVQQRLVSVLTMPVVAPLVAVAWTAWCRSLPMASVRAAVRRHEFWVLTAGVALGLLLAIWAGPALERLCFAGDFEAWLLRMTGTRYDQRNALVVGWAMGFAVIPIIFTICEDAFSAVPKHLVGASLACGASAWQTAWRVVLPAAGSGVFSAVMVGFGRAVGETMIVLMATGNTPVMDLTMFNGFRALSANVAVEIPEAPYGGTLYRILFVAALLLFAMTFLVNTVAELIRLRLRRQLQGL